MGKPCVSGAGAIRIDYAEQTMTAGGVAKLDRFRRS